MLVMRSERHKYPPHSMVITSASAIDSSNRCLEGLVCACRLMAVWRFRMSFRESGLCWGETGEGLKPDHSFLAVIRANLLYICNTVDVHYSCMSTWNRKKKKKKDLPLSLWSQHTSDNVQSTRGLTGQPGELRVTDWFLFSANYWPCTG